MDPLSVRSRGRRAAPRGRKGGPLSMGPHQGLSGGGRPGEFRLNGQQMEALEQLYTGSPAIAAARSVLHGQLLGGGIVLRRNGEDVELKAEFQRYLSTKWLAFAGDCLDSYLKWGLVVVAYDEDYELQRTKKKAAAGAETPAVLAPLVPPRECVEVSYVQGGRMGYTREFLVYNTGPNFASRADEDARVFIREQPDAAGNVLSPMSKSFELGSFVHALTELALTAEITCARPRIWTQQRVKNGKEMDSSSLFFDSESRQVATDLDIEGNTAAAQALSMQSQLVQLINKLQTRKQEDNGMDIQRGSFSGRGVAAGSTSHVPPEVPPAIMSLPKDQEVAPSTGQLPSARGDLEALQRLSIELFGAAFGVPADLLFNGRFASKSTSQLSLLNSTIVSLAKSLNQVLTAAYHDVYGGDGTETLELVTSPLAATEEVINLHAAGLCPAEVAVPAALHALGASKEQITKAVEDAVKLREKTEGKDDTVATDEKRQRDQEHGANEQRVVVEIEGAKAAVEKVKAETASIKKGDKADADAPAAKKKKAS